MENLDCPELINEFESRLAEINSPKRKLEQDIPAKKKKLSTIEIQVCSFKCIELDFNNLYKQEKPSSGQEPRGFDKYVPEKILGATDAKGEVFFLMKWKNSNEADLVPARIANIKCPQVVIKFYEERLIWHTTNDDENVDLQPVNVQATNTTSNTGTTTTSSTTTTTAAPSNTTSSNLIEHHQDSLLHDNNERGAPAVDESHGESAVTA